MINGYSLFHVDKLAFMMMIVVMYIGLCVGRFAYRYLEGNKKFKLFFIQLTLLIASVISMVFADNLILFLLSWSLSNILLWRLMMFTSNWKAAKASGMLALKNYALGGFCLAASFFLLYLVTGETSLQKIVLYHGSNSLMVLATLFLLVAAMTQSAIWPCHRWLLSSLNSPTPVSAIMHAGLVNGGGFLLIRFSNLYLQHTSILTVIYMLGIITALLGTLWKLMQTDIKRMLACSTMAQMGFMFVQCGLGFFSAALAHLIWHGMFKAYLFLASGSAAQEKRFNSHYPPTLLASVISIICGFISSLVFGLLSNKSWLSFDTTMVLMLVSFITAAQLVLPLLHKNSWKTIFSALFVSLLFGAIYGASIQCITLLLSPMHLIQAQPLNIVYVFGMFLLLFTWAARLFVNRHNLKAYVIHLNASQPHPNTITTCRNEYHY